MMQEQAKNSENQQIQKNLYELEEGYRRKIKSLTLENIYEHFLSEDGLFQKLIHSSHLSSSSELHLLQLWIEKMNILLENHLFHVSFSQSLHHPIAERKVHLMQLQQNIQNRLVLAQKALQQLKALENISPALLFSLQQLQNRIDKDILVLQKLMQKIPHYLESKSKIHDKIKEIAFQVQDFWNKNRPSRKLRNKWIEFKLKHQGQNLHYTKHLPHYDAMSAKTKPLQKSGHRFFKHRNKATIAHLFVTKYFFTGSKKIN